VRRDEPQREGPTAPAVDFTGALVTRNVRLPLSALFACALCVAWLGTFGFHPFAVLVAWLGAWLGVLTLLRDAFKHATPVAARVEDGVLTVGDLPPIAVDDIVEATVKPFPRGNAVDLHLTVRGRKPFALRVDHAQVLDLFERLGVTPGQRRASFKLRLPFWQRFLGWLLVVAPTLGVLAGRDLDHVVALVPQVLMLSAVLAFVTRGLPARMVVGTDGLVLRRLGLSRFIPFGSIREITPKSALLFSVPRVAIALHDGSHVVVTVVENADTSEDVGLETRALMHHAQQALWAAQMKQMSPREIGAMLSSHSRSGRDWLAAIDGIAPSGGAHYRVAAVGEGTFGEILGDTNAPTDARVGAAVAMIRVGADEARRRVRVAAEATADASTRSTLLEICDAETDDDLAAALERRS
jgi:hypothetical protein